MCSQAISDPDVFRNARDVLVIGAGPAGLSASLALGRVLRSVVIFDSGEYRNSASSHAPTIPTHDHKNPADIRSAMANELKAKYKTIEFAGVGARLVRQDGPIFEVEDVTGQLWKGRKVIIATGSRDVLPDLPGYHDAWGQGIFHCLFCRGFEEAGVSNAAVLITSGDNASIEDAMFNAHMARHFSQDITFLTNGQVGIGSHPQVTAAKASGFKVDNRSILSLHKLSSGALMSVTFKDTSSELYGFIAHSPRTEIRGVFAEQLGLEMTPGGDIAVMGPLQESSRRGVFAAGDCATFIKQVAVGMGTGVTAGIGANIQIVEDDMSN